MQTQYQLLYRYINETTNTAITNEYDYKETKVFYNYEHQLYFTKEQLKDIGLLPENVSSNTAKKRTSRTQFEYDNNGSFFGGSTAVSGGAAMTTLFNSPVADQYVSELSSAAELERESLIASEMANENKSNNLYVYKGTTKEYHQKFVPETVGFKVANPSAVPKEQYPDGPNDYSKHFVMLGGSKVGVDEAYLVCKSEYIDAYATDYAELNPDRQQIILTGEKFANNMMFDWYNPQDSSYIPHYGETPARLEDITVSNNNTVDSIYGGARILNLDGEDYLITEADEYVCTGAVINTSTFTASSYPYTTTTTYYYAYSGAIQAFHHENYGTLFFNGSDSLIPQITFASADNTSLLNATTVFPTFSDSTKAEDVVAAMGEYAQSIMGISCATTVNSTLTAEASGKQGSAMFKSIKVYKGWKVSDLKAANLGNYILHLTVVRDNITRVKIPAHYEPSGKAPYLIKDNYEKIPLSPWVLHSVHNSLESGLSKAKELVSMIGLDNVKLIKYVPFDQFVKIK